MLVLTRKVRQKIIINSEITITYLGHDKYHPEQVRIGIEAPIDSEIFREELQEKVIKYGRFRNKSRK